MKKWMKWISLVLVLTMSTESIPVYASGSTDGTQRAAEAESDAVSPDADAGSESAEEAGIVGEIETLRGEDTKHYMLENGSFIAVQYDTPVHYQTDNGQWEDIDNRLGYYPSASLSAAGDPVSAYRTDNGAVSKAFAASLEDGFLFREAYEDTSVILSLADPEAADAGEADMAEADMAEADMAEADPEAADPSSAAGAFPSAQYEVYDKSVQAELQTDNRIRSMDVSEHEAATTPGTLSSALMYPDVCQGVDLAYENYGYDIKESIIVNEKKDSYHYGFVLELDNLAAGQLADQSILLTRKSDGAEMFRIAAPYMLDAAGAASSDVRYDLKQLEEGRYLLDVTADTGWINDKERQFPVVIDPSLEVISGTASGQISSTYVRQGSPGSAQTAWRNLYAGYSTLSTEKQMEIYLHVNTLPSIPDNCVLVNSRLAYYCPDTQAGYSYVGTSMQTLRLEAHELTPAAVPPNYASWIQNLTWNTRPAYDTTVVDYASASAAAKGTYLIWNVTPAVQKWYGDPNTNKGLAIIPESNTWSSGKAAFAGLYGYGSTCPSKLLVYYRNTVGLESYYTYRSEPADRAGTLHINDFTQQMTLTHDDLEWESTVNGFSLQHVYNTANGNAAFTNNGSAGIHTTDFSGMQMGAGWKLSAQQTVTSVKIGTVTYLVYNDADGTEHYFRYSSADAAYLDEDGLGLKIKKSTSGSNTIYTMTDTDAYHTWVFYNGYLNSVKDSNGNSQYFAYNNNYNYDPAGQTWKPAASGTNRLVQIVSVIDGGGTAVLANFSYNSAGYLSSVTDYAGRQISYSYTGDRLTQITDPDGTFVTYAYHSDSGLMKSACDGESKYGVGLSYQNGFQGKWTVYMVREYAESAGGIQYGGAFHAYKDSALLSSYRFYGADHTAGTDDDTVERFVFDYEGRTTCAYEQDNKEAVVGAESSDYTASSGTSRTNNRLAAASASGIENVNLLRDSGCENSSSLWVQKGDAPGNSLAAAVRGAYTANGVTVIPRTGGYMLKMYMEPAEGQSGRKTGMFQAVTLTAGTTYTLSGYLNTQSMYQTCDDDGGLRLCILNTDSTAAAWGDPVRDTTSASIDNGWEKSSVTFTPATGGTYYVGVMMKAASVIAACDDLKLETGNTPSAANLLQNGSFENSGDWTMGSGVSVTTAGTSFGNHVVQITGRPSEAREAIQAVPLNCPGNTTFILSGWGKASSVYCPGEQEDSSSKRVFGFVATINYSDGTTERHVVPLNPDYTGWQYVSKPIVPKKSTAAVASMTIAAAFSFNANTAVFDHLVLTKEPVSTYAYDKDGNLVSASDGSPAKTACEYYSNSHLLKKYTDTAGISTELTYEAGTHNVLTSTSGDVRVTNTYNSSGSVTSGRTQSSSGTGAFLETRQAYNTSGNRVVSATDASGLQTQYSYDENRNRLTATTNPGGLMTCYSYESDHSDRLAASYISGTVSVDYDYSNGFTSGIERGSYEGSGSGREKTYQKYNFALDPFGNTTAISVHRGGSDRNYGAGITLASYLYDSSVNNGNLSRMTYGNGDSVSYTYDAFDRVTEERYNDGKALHYLYSSDGDLAEQYVTGADGNVTERYLYTYDSRGRLIRSKQNSGEKMLQRTQHLYDAADRLTSQSWQLGNTAYTESFGYDNKGNLNTYVPAVGSANTYTYDSLNRLSRVSGNGVYTKEYTYRDINAGTGQTSLNVRDLKYTIGSNATTYNYTYDAAGRISTEKQDFLETTEKGYSYDAQSQLTGVSDRMADLFYSYTYDTAGNLLTAKAHGDYHSSEDFAHTYTYGNDRWRDLLTAYDGEKIAYEGQVYDPSLQTVSGTPVSGNPVSYYNGSRYTFTWQHGRQLASASKGSTNVSYAYDLNGIRSRKTVGNTAYQYMTQNGQVVRQTWGSKVIDFIYDNNGTPYAFRYSTDGGSTYTVYYYILNQQGDITKVVNTGGTTVASYTYDPWGKVKTASGSMASVNPLRYRGYYYDSETGLYYLQSRYYDPAVGRFISADDPDILFEDHDNILENNLYTYCFDNPVNMVDLDGKFARYASTAAIYSGLTLGGIVGTALVIIGVILFVYCSGKLIKKGISYFQEHRTTKNGSKKKSNDKHTKPRPGRQGEKKKQKPGWKKRR